MTASAEDARSLVWDALIWAAAAENGITVIYTEDFRAVREVEGVRFANPFLVVGPPTA